MQFNIVTTETADEDMRRQIAAPLVRFNEAQAGPSGYRPLVLALHDEAGDVQGGLWGHTAYGWLFVQLLVVPEGQRRGGLGRTLMQRAEAEALQRGCHGAWLDTHTFQARGFYEKLGYTAFGQLDDYPAGQARIFFRKRLAALRA